MYTGRLRTVTTRRRSQQAGQMVRSKNMALLLT